MILNIPITTILERLDYKGGPIHVQDLYLVAARMGRYLVPFERKPIFWDGQKEVPVRRSWGWLSSVMFRQRGLISGYTASGSGHMVAWDGQEIFDPLGLTYAYRFCKAYNFRPDTFHLLAPFSTKRIN